LFEDPIGAENRLNGRSLMIARIVLGLALACVASAASAQDGCTFYKVNTSLLNVSKDPGGDIYNDALFDGDTACVTRLANVKGSDWAYIASKVEGTNRTPVEGWAALQYLQPTASDAASAPAAPAAPPPVAAAPPPMAPAAPAAPGAGAGASAPAASPNATATARLEDMLRFDQPIPFGPFPLNGHSLKEMIDTVPLFPPLEGLEESMWKKNCTSCHQWNQQRLCEQGATYVQMPRNVLRVPHPFGGALKLALMKWAKSGCP
jgi:hypothetical protein